MMDHNRRAILTNGVAVATVAATVGISRPSIANAADRMPEFIELSSALTGIKQANLAPGERLVPGSAPPVAPGVDPFGVARRYFEIAQHQPAFDDLLKAFAEKKKPGDVEQKDAVNNVLNNSSDDISYLARSILLAWYTGEWWDPAELRNSIKNKTAVESKVISPAAYTRGWIWRIAEAHPMGYSEQQFGYWSVDRPDDAKFDNFII